MKWPVAIVLKGRGAPYIRVQWPHYEEYYSLSGYCQHRSHRLNLKCLREMSWQSACGKHQDCNSSYDCPTFGPANMWADRGRGERI